MNIVEQMGMDSTKYGGLERFNIELLKYTQAKGDKIFFIYETEPEVQEFINDIEQYGGKLIILNSRRKRIKYITSLYKLIKKEDIDIFHAHFTPARFISIPFLYYFSHVKLFQTIHSSFKKIKFKTKYYYKYFLMNHCYTLTVSEQIRKDCIRTFGDKYKVKTAYLGVSENNFLRNDSRRNFNFGSSELIIATVASFNFRKGLDILVNAAEILKHEGIITDNIKFLIIGQPLEEKIELQKLIDQLNLTQYFNLYGIRNDIPFLLKSVDIYCQPSRSEGIPLSLMEAVSASLPIIASNIDGIREIVDNTFNGILFEAESIMDLAIALKTLIISPEKRSILASNSKEIFNKFNIINNVSNIYSMYYKIFNES
jgi:L-malate glycosyltransferase